MNGDDVIYTEIDILSTEEETEVLELNTSVDNGRKNFNQTDKICQDHR